MDNAVIFMKTILAYLLLFLFCTVAFFLGSRMLLHHDFFYLADQARDFTLVRDIVVQHKLTLIGSHSGLGGLFHGPLWLYLLIPFYILGGGDPFIFTYAYVLIPFVTILAGFFIGKQLYGHKTGLLLAFFLAINSVLYSYTIVTIGINLMPLLCVFFLFFCINYLRGNTKAFIGITFLAGLSFQLETASAIALLVVTLFTFFYQVRKINVQIILVSILSFIISMGTFVLFDVRHKFLMLFSTLQLLNQHEGHKDYTTFFARVLDHGKSMMDTYLSILFTPNIFFIILLIAIIGFALYFFFTHWKETKELQREVLFYAVFPLIVYAFYLLYPHPIYKEYVLDLTVSLVFGFSVLLVTLWKTRIGKGLVLIFIASTIFIVGLQLYTTYHAPYTPDSTGGSYQNQKQVIDWIWHDAKEKPFGYFVYTPETFTYGTDYLFTWEATKQHIAIPESKKLETTYLILAPPLTNDKQAHQFWKVNTIHTNAPVSMKKEFTGGVIVEKLHIASHEAEVDPNYYQNLIFR